MKKIKDFEKVIEFAPDAMIIVDYKGTIGYVNLQAERMFGYNRSELVDNQLEILIPNRFATKHVNHRNTYFKSPHVRPMGSGLTLFGLRKDRTEFPIEISLSPIEQEGLVAAAIRDISEKVKLNERFQNLLESAPDAIVMVNKKGVIELVNLQTEKLFGYGREELIGKEIEILMPDRFVERHPQHRAGFFSNPHVRPMGSGLKLFGKRKDNTEFPIEISLSPIEKEGLVAAAIRDVTEKFLNSYLINKTKQLEDFAYITSHNLRSPVSNLTSLVHFYKEEKTETGKELLYEKFEQTVAKLSETLNNLMDVLIVQQDSNKIKTNINFELVLKRVRFNLESMIQLSDAEIVADFEEAPEVMFSKIYLESIIQNLLSNAIKYASPLRKPVIHIRSSMHDDKVKLVVSDNGLGIDLSKHGSKIFGLNKVFHKHPDSKGVGLFITKAQVDAMGGEIKVDSKVDVGTTFTIIF